MAIKGRLDDLRLGAVLQLLALSGNSGRLSLAQPAGEGLIILRKGRIIFAASSSVREAIGNILLCKGLITDAQLKRALETQHASETERRLGTILVEAGFVSQEALQNSVNHQVRRVLHELLEWDQGFFHFDRFEVHERAEIEVEASDFFVDDGLAADKLLLDGIAEQLESEETDTEPPEARSLRSVMREFRTPSFTGEVTLPVLDYARNLVRRGALFSASPSGFSGVGQFGFDSDGSSGARRVRAIRLPLREPSVFREAIARREPHILAPEDNPTNRGLLRQLGGGWPVETLVAPLVVSGRVLMIFYGDNLPADEPIGSMGGFAEVLSNSALTTPWIRTPSHDRSTRVAWRESASSSFNRMSLLT
ncbi:MAG: DUF4388 domain-containing protein [bacterium]|nr:DUF4388 domain-containing protein [bacterium]